MKFFKFIVCISLIIVFASNQRVFSASETSEKIKTATEAANSGENVKLLREKIASQAARVREQNKKAFFGKYSEMSSGNLILKTKHGNKTVVTLESTKFVQVTSGSRKTSELASLIKGSEVVAFGTVDSKDILTARWVLYFPKKRDINKESIVGRVISKTDATLSLKSLKKETVTPVLISEDAKVYLEGKETSIKNLTVGQTVIIIGGFNDNDVFEADKIIPLRLKLQLPPLVTATESAKTR